MDFLAVSLRWKYRAYANFSCRSSVFAGPVRTVLPSGMHRFLFGQLENSDNLCLRSIKGWRGMRP